MGTKLHTLLLKNSCTSLEEDEGFKKVNLLARWPTVVAEKGFILMGFKVLFAIQLLSV